MDTLIRVGLLAAAAWFFGTPHLRVEYVCHGLRGECLSYIRCDYFGLEGWRYLTSTANGCPVIRLFPVKWRPFG